MGRGVRRHGRQRCRHQPHPRPVRITVGPGSAVSGVRVEARTSQPWTALRAGGASDRRRADSLPAVLAVGAAAVVLPFVVVPAWYDPYYWPKVCALYAAVAVGVLSLLRTDGALWLRDLGAPLRTALG